MSVVSVVCCCVEVSATADESSRGVLPSVVCACDRQATTVRYWPTTVRYWPTRGCCAIKIICIL